MGTEPREVKEHTQDPLLSGQNTNTQNLNLEFETGLLVSPKFSVVPYRASSVSSNLWWELALGLQPFLLPNLSLLVPGWPTLSPSWGPGLSLDTEARVLKARCCLGQGLMNGSCQAFDKFSGGFYPLAIAGHSVTAISQMRNSLQTLQIQV